MSDRYVQRELGPGPESRGTDMSELRHKIEVPGFPRHVGPTPGHLTECLVVTVSEFVKTFGGSWPPEDADDWPWCTCEDYHI